MPQQHQQQFSAIPGGWQEPVTPREYSHDAYLTSNLGSPLNTASHAEKMSVHSSVIDMCLMAPDTLHGLIQNHPEVIKERGFNGQTLLHRAVLSAQYEAIQILLDHGADPNMVNHHSETPLHFACKRGHPRIIHALITAGGNLAIVDNSGKMMIHHSSHGGCVPGLHYLAEVHGLSLKVADKDGNTPLHISCFHGHVEATAYLLKKERSDLVQINHAGDTSLHIVARLGHSLLSWKLLEHGCVRLLQQPNKQGYTPLDLVRQLTEIRYDRAKQIFEYYARQLQTNKRGSLAPNAAEGPGLVWWLLLFLPFILYGIAVSLTCYYDNHGAPIMIVSMVVILTFCGQQGHRMKHITSPQPVQWPNPAFMGMFGAGLSHTTISYYVKLLPILFDQYTPIAYLSLLYAAGMIYMYYKLLTKDPGVVSMSDLKPSGDCYSILDVATNVKPIEAFCRTCEIIPPPRSKHCKLCERCFVDMDHHCLFLYRCIARHNHMLFVRFIMVCMGAMLLYEFFCYYLIFTTYKDKDGLFGISFSSIFFYEPWIWSLMATNLVSWFWGYTLIYFQLSVISKGYTSYFQPSYGRTTLNWRQRLFNIIYFILGRRPYAIDQVFNRIMLEGR